MDVVDKTRELLARCWCQHAGARNIVGEEVAAEGSSQLVV